MNNGIVEFHESSKMNSGKAIRLFELEAEVPKRIVNSNFCFWSEVPKPIVNDNWFWSGDGERMAEKHTDRLQLCGFVVVTLSASSLPL